MLSASERIIVALDCEREEALSLAQRLRGHAQWVKVGMTLYYACGPEIVHAMHDAGLKVFLDLKLHDIPHQIHGAARSASDAGADILSIHGLGAGAMIAAAREGVNEAAANREDRTKLVSITVLTSMNQQSLASIGIECSIAEEVQRLATLACSHGSDGIVCSPQEAAAMRTLLGPEALIVTPGVRPAGATLDDQQRVATPAQAIADGASMIVIGRPITQAQDPVAAFDAIVEELK
ncbi:orotidine-5'-phosphate decarboxylase [Atopobium fossor]|uniref:orotidine-5'-phosphate decarboxylase n=1 Tax=Atopobium fossor TaxID=39487 RepID=UPI000426EAA6|nr:orotidine-5'-phosphate decarboxylase [Atopobium fossor]